MSVNEVYPNAGAALDGLLHDGMMIMSGGFGICGIPDALIDAIHDAGTQNLTVVSNNAGIDGSLWGPDNFASMRITTGIGDRPPTGHT